MSFVCLFCGYLHCNTDHLISPGAASKPLGAGSVAVEKEVIRSQVDVSNKRLPEFLVQESYRASEAEAPLHLGKINISVGGLESCLSTVSNF